MKKDSTSNEADCGKNRSALHRFAESRMVWFACLVLLFVLSGCTTTIVPPSVPQGEAARVAIVDYGHHASLVLPDGRNGAVEYEYGEWRWFALGQTGSPRIIPTLFWPTQGALGRRIHNHPVDPVILRQTKEDANEVMSFYVPAHAVTRLRERLNGRYESNIETEVENPEWGMTFVKDPARYSAFHNCNHRLALWLRELGCETRGHATFAMFRVKERNR
ncbi:MAG: DUF2459 domain-containing protein [Limisphaerales bacterium]